MIASVSQMEPLPATTLSRSRERPVPHCGCETRKLGVDGLAGGKTRPDDDPNSKSGFQNGKNVWRLSMLQLACRVQQGWPRRTTSPSKACAINAGRAAVRREPQKQAFNAKENTE